MMSFESIRLIKVIHNSSSKRALKLMREIDKRAGNDKAV